MQKFLSKIRTGVNEFWQVKFATFWDSVMIVLGVNLGAKRLYVFGDGFGLWYDPRTLDNMVIRECMINNLYTKFLVDKELEVVVDLGFHKGYFATGLVRNGYKIGKLIGVEPLIENIEWFRENCELNKHSCDMSMVGIENVAVDCESGEKTFFITQNSVNHSLKNPDKLDKVVNKVLVKVEKLGDILSKYKIDKIDLLKIDIEGSEFDLFNSDQLKYILQADKIVMEIHPDEKNKARDLIDKLATCGYKYSFPHPAYEDLVFFSK
jgi:FkbM family methyltransferase